MMDPNTTPTTPAMEPKKDNKVMYLVVGAVIVILITIVAIWYVSATNQPTPQSSAPQTDNTIRNSADLTKVESTLDSSNIDGLGSELNLNDTDASQF